MGACIRKIAKNSYRKLVLISWQSRDSDRSHQMVTHLPLLLPCCFTALATFILFSLYAYVLFHPCCLQLASLSKMSLTFISNIVYMSQLPASFSSQSTFQYTYLKIKMAQVCVRTEDNRWCLSHCLFYLYFVISFFLSLFLSLSLSLSLSPLSILKDTLLFVCHSVSSSPVFVSNQQIIII